LTKFVIATVLAGILWCGSIASLAIYITTKSNKIETQANVPTFQRGDCFRLVSQDEVWNTIPDGIVERVGKRNYLVLWKEQAEKRGGTKSGATLEIKVFDELNTKIECPKSWIKHTSKT